MSTNEGSGILALVITFCIGLLGCCISICFLPTGVILLIVSLVGNVEALQSIGMVAAVVGGISLLLGVLLLFFSVFFTVLIFCDEARRERKHAARRKEDEEKEEKKKKEEEKLKKEKEDLNKDVLQPKIEEKEEDSIEMKNDVI